MSLSAALTRFIKAAAATAKETLRTQLAAMEAECGAQLDVLEG